MKKFFLLIISVLLGITFFGCSERAEEETPATETPGGVTVSFDTGFDMINVEPLYLDGTTETYMPDNPVYSGYVFLGWYYDEEGTRPFRISDGFTEDTTLYAKWERLYFLDDETKQSENVVEEDGFVFLKKDGQAYLTSYTGFYPDITIPSSVSEIPVVGISYGAFSGTLVRSIRLPVGLISIEGGAFAGATRLESLEISSADTLFCTVDGILFNKAKTTLICLPAKKNITEYVLPSGITDVYACALYGSRVRLSFAENTAIAEIKEYAFSGFRGTLDLPATVCDIRKNAFSGADCQINFSEGIGLTALDNGEFDGYIGERITLPVSVKSISGAAFCNCTAEVDLSRTGITRLGDKAFYSYAGAKLRIPDSVVSFGSGCFYLCSSEITFDERTAIQTIGENSFGSFRGKVVFPATVNRIERYAFYNARSGAEIIFSCKKNQMAIDENAFTSCNATVTYQ